MLEIEVDLLTTGMVEQSSMSSQIGGLEEEEDARFSGEKMRDFERARPLEEGEAEAGGGEGERPSTKNRFLEDIASTGVPQTGRRKRRAKRGRVSEGFFFNLET